MLRGDHLAKSPHRNVAETFRRRKQLPVFQLIAEHGVGDVVGGEARSASILTSSASSGSAAASGSCVSINLHCCRSLRATTKSVDFIVSIPAFSHARDLCSRPMTVLQQQQCLKHVRFRVSALDAANAVSRSRPRASSVRGNRPTTDAPRRRATAAMAPPAAPSASAVGRVFRPRPILTASCTARSPAGQASPWPRQNSR